MFKTRVISKMIRIWKTVLEHQLREERISDFRSCDHEINSWMNTNDANKNIGTLSISLEDVLCEEMTHLSELEMIYITIR